MNSYYDFARVAKTSRSRAAGPPLARLRLAHGHAEISQQPVRECVDPAMDAERLTARPGVLHEDVGGDVAHLANHVELAEAIETGARIGDRVELVPMLVAHFTDGM